MGKIDYSLEPRRENAEKPRQSPRPGNLPRSIGPDMMFAPAAIAFAVFSMGFAAGVMWMGWFRG